MRIPYKHDFKLMKCFKRPLQKRTTAVTPDSPSTSPTSQILDVLCVFVLANKSILCLLVHKSFH